jgi:hypothetical protein
MRWRYGMNLNGLGLIVKMLLKRGNHPILAPAACGKQWPRRRRNGYFPHKSTIVHSTKCTMYIIDSKWEMAPKSHSVHTTLVSYGESKST